MTFSQFLLWLKDHIQQEREYDRMIQLLREIAEMNYRQTIRIQELEKMINCSCKPCGCNEEAKIMCQEHINEMYDAILQQCPSEAETERD